MRRIALISDMHGNLLALEAVLADIASRGVTELYCLGDLVGYGPDPAGVIERVRSLGIPTVRGNYDDGVGNRFGACGCYYATDQDMLDGEASYAFTDGALSDADHEWLAALEDEIRLEHHGVRVLLAHGSPRAINEYLMPDRTEKQLVRLAKEAETDVVCCGHVHIPYHRVFTTEEGQVIHYVNSGSVGKPKDGDTRAGWVELVLGTKQQVAGVCDEEGSASPAGIDADGPWVGTRVHRLAYDIESVARAMGEAGLPPTLVEALLQA